MALEPTIASLEGDAVVTEEIGTSMQQRRRQRRLPRPGRAAEQGGTAAQDKSRGV